jgi:hypothetical protein
MSEARKLIAELLDAVGSEIRAEVASEIRMFLEHDEWGLAYDDFIFLIREGDWRPNDAQIDHLKRIASSMGGQFPNLSTDS